MPAGGILSASGGDSKCPGHLESPPLALEFLSRFLPRLDTYNAIDQSDCANHFRYCLMCGRIDIKMIPSYIYNNIYFSIMQALEFHTLYPLFVLCTCAYAYVKMCVMK